MRAQRAGQREIYETVAYYVQHLVASQEGGLGPGEAWSGSVQFILISLACPKGSTRELRKLHWQCLGLNRLFDTIVEKVGGDRGKRSALLLAAECARIYLISLR